MKNIHFKIQRWITLTFQFGIVCILKCSHFFSGINLSDGYVFVLNVPVQLCEKVYFSGFSGFSGFLHISAAILIKITHEKGIWVKKSPKGFKFVSFFFINRVIWHVICQSEKVNPSPNLVDVVKELISTNKYFSKFSADLIQLYISYTNFDFS